MFWIILLAWLYVILMVAVTSNSVIQGILLFGGVGILPAWLALWFFAIPIRRRARLLHEQQDASSTEPENPQSGQPDQ
ncbi:MAG: hypothetical protein U1F63_03670 [Chitinivorax sp.]